MNGMGVALGVVNVAFIVVGFLIAVGITRWAFSIGKMVRLLDDIAESLEQIRKEAKADAGAGQQPPDVVR